MDGTGRLARTQRRTLENDKQQLHVQLGEPALFGVAAQPAHQLEHQRRVDHLRRARGGFTQPSGCALYVAWAGWQARARSP
jgi:hypothetical protein